MQLLIDGQMRTFAPIQQFRGQHNLPHSFGLATFAGAGGGLHHITHLQAELQVIRIALLDALPDQLPTAHWPGYLPELVTLFQNKLDEVNPQIGMGDDLIDLTVAGFEALCRQFVLALAQAGPHNPPGFAALYTDWLSASVRIDPNTHSYIHQGAVWAVQIISHAYGRVGLIIWTEAATYYVHDPVLACPAESFMQLLFEEVTGRIVTSARAAASA